MKKIQLSGVIAAGRVALVDDEDFDRLSRYSWYVSTSGGYATRGVNKDGVRSTERMHHAVLGKREGFEIDHINRDKLDNRKENLQFLTHSLNVAKANRKKGASGIKGVYKNHSSATPWQARLTRNGRQIYLGCFYTVEEAAQAVAEYNKNTELAHGVRFK